MPRADKAVKCKEDGVTRFLSDYTIFFLWGTLLEWLRGALYLFHYIPNFLLVRQAY